MLTVTRVYDWLSKAIGLDDPAHHGLSFTKLVLAWFAWCVGSLLVPGTPMTWPLVFLVLIIVAGAFGRSMLRDVIAVLKERWTGTATENVNANVTVDAAAVITAASEAIRKRRDSTKDAEPT